MSQFDYIKKITEYALKENNEQLKESVRGLIDYSRKIKKHNFALELQSILRESQKKKAANSGVTGYIPSLEQHQMDDQDLGELILEKLSSEYSFRDLISDNHVKETLKLLIKEQQNYDYLKKYHLPVSNKLFLYGPSGCGKTLAAYVLAGELKRPVYVVNVGAVVSSKLGNTSKNLSKLFHKAARSEAILFFDEFDTLGKLRDYSQDHAEMKRVVNTFLQLFDYLPDHVVLIAATNHDHIIDQALLRRFDYKLKLNLPDKQQIKDLVYKIKKSGSFKFEKGMNLDMVAEQAEGLSYFSIQKTLVQTLKKSLFDIQSNTTHLSPAIDTRLWLKLIELEKQQQDEQRV